MLRVLFLLTVALVSGLAWAERVEKLSTGWRFSPVSETEGDFISPDYDDSARTQVEVPHDWAIAGPFDAISHDGATGPNAKKGVGAEVVPELDFDGGGVGLERAAGETPRGTLLGER